MGEVREWEVLEGECVRGGGGVEVSALISVSSLSSCNTDPANDSQIGRHSRNQETRKLTHIRAPAFHGDVHMLLMTPHVQGQWESCWCMLVETSCRAYVHMYVGVDGHV